MGTISLQLPVSGTIVTAGLHSSNYGTLQTVINGGLDNNNFASGKIFDPTKIMQSAATTGQTLIWNGTNWAAGSASPVIARKTTAKVVNNTTTETDLLNGEVTVAANAIGANGTVRLTAWGDGLYGSGSSLPRLKLKLGATTLLDTGVLGASGTGAHRDDWRVDAIIQNRGAANAQSAQLTLAGSYDYPGNGLVTYALLGGFAVGSGSNVIWGNMTSGSQGARWGASGYGTGAVDTTGAQALALTVTLPTASASYEMQLVGAIVEVL